MLNKKDELHFAPEDEFEFADENEDAPLAQTHASKWKILIVDDEPSIHDVTKLALTNFEYDGRTLEFIHAYSGEEAREVLLNHHDVAVALIDVVMETEHSGLDLVKHIREEQGNELLRIILRTGQPGQAPERKVICDYDINDYKEKTELSSQKLFSTIYTSLRSYRDLLALEENRKGLRRIINASSEMFQKQKLDDFVQGVLEQLVAILYLDKDSIYLNCDCFAIESKDKKPTILAGTGKFMEHVGESADKVLDNDTLSVIKQSFEKKSNLSGKEYYTAYFSPNEKSEDLLYFSTPRNLTQDDYDLIQLFCQNVSIAYKNILLHQELEDTQREIVYMLGEAIESRSKETGSHVRRVAEYSKILARYSGLSDYEVNAILVASPLHDFGKISIPDAVLNKPGKLDKEEWAVMQKHAEVGEEMLKKSNRYIMQVAAIIAGQHHEKWNGNGYPSKLKGEDIHIYARIAALADVYDALLSPRCYKEPWPKDKVLSLINEESGKHFDPHLVKLLIENIGEFDEVAEQYPYEN